MVQKLLIPEDSKNDKITWVTETKGPFKDKKGVKMKNEKWKLKIAEEQAISHL